MTMEELVESAGLTAWRKVVASIPCRYGHWKHPEPSLLAYGYLRRLAVLFEDLVRPAAAGLREKDSISSLLNRLVVSVSDDATARTVFLFFMEVSVLLWDTLATAPVGIQLLDLFCSFFRQLKARFSRLDCFKSCVLSLMAVAAPASAEKLKELRSLNTMSLEETFEMAETITSKVPLACYTLLRCGFALQASLDVESGVSCSSLPVDRLLRLADAFLPLYMRCRLPVYLEKFIGLLGSMAHFRTGTVDTSTAAKLVSDINTVLDQEQAMEPNNPLRLLVPDILGLLSPVSQLKVLRAIIENNPFSREVLILVQHIELIFSWPPTEQQGVGNEFFWELRSLLEYLFTSGAIYVYPTDDEETAVLVGQRRPLEQLNLVLMLVHVPLYFIRQELKGGTSFTGLLAPEVLIHVREVWLAPLLQQAREAVFTELTCDRGYAEDVLAYAVDVTRDPSLVLRQGLFLTV